MKKKISRAEKNQLLELDYITLKDFSKIIGRDTRTVRKEINKHPSITYIKGWGYLTEDLIQTFKIKKT